MFSKPQFPNDPYTKLRNALDPIPYGMDGGAVAIGPLGTLTFSPAEDFVMDGFYLEDELAAEAGRITTIQAGSQAIITLGPNGILCEGLSENAQRFTIIGGNGYWRLALPWVIKPTPGLRLTFTGATAAGLANSVIQFFGWPLSYANNLGIDTVSQSCGGPGGVDEGGSNAAILREVRELKSQIQGKAGNGLSTKKLRPMG